MKKHFLLITLFLTALFVLNGCALFTTYKIAENTIDKEKEVFAVDETQGGEVKTPDEVSVVENESEVVAEETVLPTGLPHEYVVESDEGEILAPDGSVLATYSYTYPVFRANAGDKEEYIATINEMIKENALSIVSDANQDYDILLEEYEYYEDGWSRHHNQYTYDFGIHTDAKGIISITEIWYYYTGGAHGNTAKESHTFDVVNGKELSLSDLLYGTDEEITAAFTQKFAESEYAEFEFFGDPFEIVPEELPNAQYYVDPYGVTVYFQEYQVGPYAAGFVSATITDKEMLKIDFSDVTVE